MTAWKGLPASKAIVAITAALVVIGVVMVFSASGVHYEVAKGKATAMSMTVFFLKQMTFVLIGLIAAVVCYFVPVTVWVRAAGWLMLVGYASLLLCRVPPFASPQENRSVYRWVKVGNVRFQPSEAVKLILVIYLACSWGRQLRDASEQLRKFGGQIVALLPIVAMLALQPDKKATVFCMVLFAAMWFMARGPTSWVALVSAVFVVLGAGAISMNRYAQERFLNWWHHNPLDAQNAWQTRGALVAYVEGGVFGVGVGWGQQKLGYLPAKINDMIFAVVAEEGGLLGATLIILLYAGLIYYGFVVAKRCDDPVSSLLAAGITLLISAQALLNIAVATVLVPTTGLCLPFISYGGSSLVVSIAAIGILVRIAAMTEKPPPRAESGGEFPRVARARGAPALPADAEYAALQPIRSGAGSLQAAGRNS